jgi:hypothetical protein
LDVTIVSPYQLTAKWITDGTDTPALDELIAYYQDTDGLVSNVATGIFIKNVVSLTFTDIDPTTVTLVSGMSANITGTGFLGSSINAMKADDGAGNVLTIYPSITDDSNMWTGSDVFSVPGVYTIYYSTDFGATWTTTGLTVTAS